MFTTVSLIGDLYISQQASSGQSTSSLSVKWCNIEVAIDGHGRANNTLDHGWQILVFSHRRNP